MTKKISRLRGLYGKPLLAQGTTAQVSQDNLKKAAAIILKAIKAEIRRDIAKSRGLRGGTYPQPYTDRDPVPLPQTERFVRSFFWRISGVSTVEFASSWPTAVAHTEKPTTTGLAKRNPPKDHRARFGAGIPMKWLVQPKVKIVPIITRDGQVIFRTAPLSLDKAWIHPGFMRYTFIERGIRKGKIKAVHELKDDLVQTFLNQGALFPP